MIRSDMFIQNPGVFFFVYVTFIVLSFWASKFIAFHHLRQFQMLGSRLDELSQHLLHTVPGTLEKAITEDILDGIEQPQVCLGRH